MVSVDCGLVSVMTVATMVGSVMLQFTASTTIVDVILLGLLEPVVDVRALPGVLVILDILVQVVSTLTQWVVIMDFMETLVDLDRFVYPTVK
tara:strand:- start:41 stop:316 length:276 start_codon:yes stop_codon:yes gene_type:complete